jgi:formylglycine-generating enzyme required for sulfatase activity
MVWVTWHDAIRYCEWLSGESGKQYHLPSEAEWEKASRSIDGRIYPWGNEWDQRCCYAQIQPSRLYREHGFPRAACDVDSYRDGASPYGALHMVGNVQQWTTTRWNVSDSSHRFDYPYDPMDGREERDASEGTRITRGSSFLYKKAALRCAYRNGYDETVSRVDLGFRVVCRN